MAFESCKSITMPAGEDLRDRYCHALTTDHLGRVIMTDAATDVVIGILAQNPSPDIDTTGEGVTVAIIGAGGRMMVELESDVTLASGEIGILVPTATSNKDGEAAVVKGVGNLAVDQMGFGLLLGSGSDGDFAEFIAQTIASPHSA
jgi:hypothetical protein